MELSSFVGRMSALKNELLSVLPKVTDAKTFLSNMDQIFMILTLIKLVTEFDNIREQILIGSAISNFDDIFAFITTLSSISLTNTIHETLSHPGWKQAMVALHSIGKWDLFPLPVGKSPIGRR